MIVFDRSVAPGDRQTLAEPGSFYVTDLEYRAFCCPARWDATHIYLDPPPDAAGPLAIHVRFAAPGYGPLWLSADNAGAGYTDSDKPWRLLVELAVSQLARCRRLPRDAPEAAAVGGLLAALPHGDHGADMGLAEAATVLGEAMRSGEDIEHALCQRRVRGPALLSGTLFGERLGRYAIGVGPDWPPAATPNFLRADHEWSVIAQACQATTLPNFWRWVEYEPGIFNWGPLDRIMDFSAAHSMSVKSFALYWGGLGSVPPWFRHLTYMAQQDAIRRWIETIIGRYRGRVSAWETVNEMHDWPFGNRFQWSHQQLMDVTRLVNDLVGQLDPGVPRIINNCAIWGHYLQLSGMAGKWSPRTYIEDVLAEGISFEGIGLQFYNPGRDMVQMALHLDRFIPLGKRIYVTEMGTPSAPTSQESETGQTGLNDGWRGEWSLDTQADWVERFLTLAAARPEVAMINYWDVDDDRAFVPSAGLLDKHGHPKPSYDAWLRCRPR